MRLLGYVRVSTDKQADSGLSIEAQRKKLSAYCELYGHTLVDVLEDAGASAKSIDRPGLQAALARLGAGEADGLLVAKLDRLTRSVSDLCALVDTFKRREWELLSVAEQIDTSTAGGRMVVNMLGVIGQWEREVIGERTRAALDELRADGVKVGPAPLGARHSEERDAAGRRLIVADQAEQAVIARIVELHSQGLSVRTIAERMTEEGRPTKSGGRWHPTTVQRILARARA
jgi:site-specific DNA recombinase